ncbi:hypothetical protein D3C76_1733500 [compost metagenome]
MDKWAQLGFEPDLVDAQTRKLFGSPLVNITDKQGKELIETLNDKLQPAETGEGA